MTTLLRSSDIQPPLFPEQPGAVRTAQAEREFDSIKEIYILRHLKKDWQPEANILPILNNELF